MQASEHLRAQVLQEFTAQVLLRLRTGAGTHLMFHRFHAETGASGAVPNGYALLHGSNSTVGDFELSGVYSTQKAPNGDWIVPAHVNCCFNDIVDPSGNKDLPGEIVAWLMTAGRHGPYKIRIHWNTKTVLRIDPNGSIKETYGYPGLVGKQPGGDFPSFTWPLESQR